MGRSFYTTKSATALYLGSIQFSTRLSASPALYGVTEQAAAEYQALHDIYAAAYLVAAETDTRTKSTIRARNDAAVPLRRRASQLGQTITANSSVTNQQRLDLGLSVRKAPEPVGPPGQPYGFKASLDNGAVILTWKCNNPRAGQGTIYYVCRSIDDGESTFLAGVGGRKFIDTTLPAGASRVTYDIQGVRTTAAGPWGTFVLRFGTSAPVPTASQTSAAA